MDKVISFFIFFGVRYNTLTHIIDHEVIRSSKFLNKLFQLVLIRTRKLIHRLLPPREHESGHRRNLELHRGILIIVDVDLAERHVGIRLGKGRVDGRDHLARGTPRRREIQDGFRVDGAEF